MPKVAYSEEKRKNIRNSLIEISLELMSKQGIQHTTVEQIYKKAGISRTFFYSFFPTKEDLDCRNIIPTTTENYRVCKKIDG